MFSMAYLQTGDTDGYLERILTALMKVSSLCTQSSVSQEALDCTNSLYRELFSWAKSGNNLSLVNNSLLVHLGLIKVCFFTSYSGVFVLN